jgi:hypothetical protein
MCSHWSAKRIKESAWRRRDEFPGSMDSRVEGKSRPSKTGYRNRLHHPAADGWDARGKFAWQRNVGGASGLTPMTEKNVPHSQVDDTSAFAKAKARACAVAVDAIRRNNPELSFAQAWNEAAAEHPARFGR